MEDRALVRHLFMHGIRSIDAEHLHLPCSDLEEGAVTLLGSGKAAATMARAALRQLGDRVKEAFIVTDQPLSIPGVTVFVSSHPIPTQRSVEAAERMLKIVSGMEEGERFCYLLSGGTSAMLEKPIAPLSLEELQHVTRLLLQSGAPISQMNRVRKALSSVKGGGLARLCKASGVVAVMSDVIGDDSATIGSAPFYDEGVDAKGALAVLRRYGLLDAVGEQRVRRVLETRQNLSRTHTKRFMHAIVASNRTLLEAVAQEARRLGYLAHIVTDRLEGDVRDAAKRIAAEAARYERGEKVCLLFGGETTVQVRGSGKGGRNQELALWVLKAMDPRSRFTFLSAGTDGIDGMSDAAGAIVQSSDRHADLEAHLQNNDSYHYHKRHGTLLKTGRTGVNVMDVAILLKG